MASPRADGSLPSGNGQPTGGSLPPALLYAAAKMYWDEDATQAEIARRLGISRANVSRLLSEARRQGIVQIAVVQPVSQETTNLADRLRTQLGLHEVYLSAPLPQSARREPMIELLGRVLSPALNEALLALSLVPGDIMLVSSGRTIYEVARHDLPSLPGVVVAPTLGGTDQPQGWYQTNEIARLIASNIGGRASYLFAPALPGPELYELLVRDESIQRVLHLWPYAQCAITSVGAPPLLREQLPQFLAPAIPSLMEAVGDISSRFFDRLGEPVDFPGSDRLIAVELSMLQRIPAVIVVAAGTERIAPLLAGARKKYFNQLVTDPATAEQLLAASLAFDDNPRDRDGAPS